MAFLYKKIGLLIFCGIFLQVSAYAENSNSKLRSLLNQITKVKTDLTQKEQQQVSVKQQLDNLKHKIIILEKNCRETSKNLKHQKEILTKMSRDQANQQAQLQEVYSALATQINSSYQTGRPNVLKDIFCQEKRINPDLLLTYHRYIMVARLEQMRNIKGVLERLERNKQKIKQQTKWLESIESKQRQQKLELEKAKQEHSKILISLKGKIATQSKKLKQLVIARKNLEKLIATLTSNKVTKMSPEVRTRLCKNFVWPTKGIIVTHFGSSIEQSSWTWSGVMIRAVENQEVHAMSSGKVVYAGLLSGYGLLLIVDHANGYMSLYGHNSSLRKGLNAKVEAGEVISTVGRSNSDEPELYFSIRRNGKPIDPEKWCR